MVHKALFRERPEAALKRVALKSFKYECHRSSFNNELSIYKESCIRNSQLFLRLLEADPDSRTLITEYCLMGNLYQYLKVWNPFLFIIWEILQKETIENTLESLSLIMSLLDALAFLHEERGLMSTDPVILHR